MLLQEIAPRPLLVALFQSPPCARISIECLTLQASRLHSCGKSADGAWPGVKCALRLQLFHSEHTLAWQGWLSAQGPCAYLRSRYFNPESVVVKS